MKVQFNETMLVDGSPVMAGTVVEYSGELPPEISSGLLVGFVSEFKPEPTIELPKGSLTSEIPSEVPNLGTDLKPRRSK